MATKSSVVLLSSLALALGLSGCSALRDRLGGGGEEGPPPPAPSLQPPAATEPVPVPMPEPPRAGGFTFPGLEDIPIPIPLPDPNAPDPEPPARGSLPPAPAASFDASGRMPRAFLEERVPILHRALLTALDPRAAAQSRAIPLAIQGDLRQPNAAAACTRASRQPAMMITAAMLELVAGIAESKAYDEVAGTTTYERYALAVVDHLRNEKPIPRPDPSLHLAPHALDPHKLARQLHLYEQQLAFIIGHELAHHHRGHTDCVSGRTDAERQRDALSRTLAHTIPTFSQPREVEADMWAMVTLLEAGRDRPGGGWSQEGALLNLDFFRRLSDQGGAELVLAFFSTHPPALVRIPIVRAAAQRWEPGWRPPGMPTLDSEGIELPTPGGNLRIPARLPIDPGELPLPFPFSVTQQ